MSKEDDLSYNATSTERGKMHILNQVEIELLVRGYQLKDDSEHSETITELADGLKINLNP